MWELGGVLPSLALCLLRRSLAYACYGNGVWDGGRGGVKHSSHSNISLLQILAVWSIHSISRNYQIIPFWSRIFLLRTVGAVGPLLHAWTGICQLHKDCYYHLCKISFRPCAHYFTGSATTAKTGLILGHSKPSVLKEHYHTKHLDVGLQSLFNKRPERRGRLQDRKSVV